SLTATGIVTVSMTSLGTQGSEQVYAAEMLQLDLSGGNLPPAMRIRESPTRNSTGETRISLDPNGYRISSFFDVFTELSTDGGLTFSPSDTPGHMEMHIDPGAVPATLVQPHIQTGKLSFSVQSQVGLRYLLEYKTNLTD